MLRNNRSEWVGGIKDERMRMHRENVADGHYKKLTEVSGVVRMGAL